MTVRVRMLTAAIVFLAGIGPLFAQDSNSRDKSRVIESCLRAAETAKTNQEWPKAEKYLGIVLELDAENVKAMTELAWIYNETGRHDKAATLALRAVLADRDDTDGWRELGYALLQKKDYSRAIDALTIAAEMGDTHAKKYLEDAKKQKRKAEDTDRDF